MLSYFAINLHYNSDCIELIVSQYAPNATDLKEDLFIELNQESAYLYGLLHARFINTRRGQALMHGKYIAGTFGTCPRVLCYKENVLPVGLSDELFKSRAKVYCPKCHEVYVSSAVDFDGAFFGTSFPHAFLKTYEKTINIAKAESYVPRICGFRVKYFNLDANKYEDC